MQCKLFEKIAIHRYITYDADVTSLLLTRHLLNTRFNIKHRPWQAWLYFLDTGDAPRNIYPMYCIILMTPSSQ